MAASERNAGDAEGRLAELRRLAARFCWALERCEADGRPPFFNEFPLGTCGDASELLAKYLGERGMGAFHYVCGWRGDGWDRKSHAWLEQNGAIVDITADQFEDQDQAVIVTIGSEWHQTFERESDHETSWAEVPAELKIVYPRLARPADAGEDRQEYTEAPQRQQGKDDQK